MTTVSMPTTQWSFLNTRQKTLNFRLLIKEAGKKLSFYLKKRLISGKRAQCLWKMSWMWSFPYKPSRSPWYHLATFQKSILIRNTLKRYLSSRTRQWGLEVWASQWLMTWRSISNKLQSNSSTWEKISRLWKRTSDLCKKTYLRHSETNMWACKARLNRASLTWGRSLSSKVPHWEMRCTSFNSSHRKDPLQGHKKVVAPQEVEVGVWMRPRCASWSTDMCRGCSSTLLSRWIKWSFR